MEYQEKYPHEDQFYSQDECDDTPFANGLAAHIELGRKGEQAAACYLMRHGYEILERNWSCPAGEADIIALDDNVLVFVEVKTRNDIDKGFPEEAVTKEKRRRYENIAAYYLLEAEYVDMRYRFDVIGIVALGNNRATLRHHVNAFGAE